MTHTVRAGAGYVDTVCCAAEHVLTRVSPRLRGEYRYLVENAMREVRTALGRHDFELAWQRTEVLEGVLADVGFLPSR
ncbi:hypothetical protein ABZ639_02645 [Saccharomonospora sp. NPDC006951]